MWVKADKDNTTKELMGVTESYNHYNEHYLLISLEEANEYKANRKYTILSLKCKTSSDPLLQACEGKQSFCLVEQLARPVYITS